MTETLDIVLPYTTESVNRLRGEHWRTTHKRRRLLEDDLFALLHEAKMKPCQSVHATACLSFTRNLRRDEGNYRAEIEKALGDVLVQRGWLPDDTPEHFTFGKVTFRKAATPSTTIALEIQR